MWPAFEQPASRVLAAVHLAQYRAVEEVAKAHGIPLDKVAGNATLEEEMQVAVASAGESDDLLSVVG